MGRWRNPGPPHHKVDLRVNGGEQLHGISFSLIHGAVITGKVTDELNGGPIAGVPLMLNSGNTPKAQSDCSLTVRTGADGRYLCHVMPGDIHVIINNATPAPGYAIPRKPVAPCHRQGWRHGDGGLYLAASITRGIVPFSNPALQGNPHLCHVMPGTITTRPRWSSPCRVLRGCDNSAVVSGLQGWLHYRGLNPVYWGCPRNGGFAYNFRFSGCLARSLIPPPPLPLGEGVGGMRERARQPVAKN